MAGKPKKRVLAPRNPAPCPLGHERPRGTLEGFCPTCNQGNRRAMQGFRRRAKHFTTPDEKAREAGRRRRIRMTNATPAWADQQAIDAIYQQAAEQGLTVDHEVPLQGRLVCGLHVQQNLRLLGRRDNSRKGRGFDPETYVWWPS